LMVGLDSIMTGITSLIETALHAVVELVAAPTAGAH
jgi:hypothetical protein